MVLLELAVGTNIDPKQLGLLEAHIGISQRNQRLLLPFVAALLWLDLWFCSPSDICRKSDAGLTCSLSCFMACCMASFRSRLNSMTRRSSQLSFLSARSLSSSAGVVAKAANLSSKCLMYCCRGNQKLAAGAGRLRQQALWIAPNPVPLTADAGLGGSGQTGAYVLMWQDTSSVKSLKLVSASALHS